MIEDHKIRVAGRDLSQINAAFDQTDRLPRPGDLDSSLDLHESFNTVVLLDALQRVSEDAAKKLLERAWTFVGSGGRLIVTVPNGDGAAGAKIGQRFTEARLKRLLKNVGKPKVVTEQQLKWLMMLVTNEGPRERRLSHTNKVRFAAVAKLCRGKVIELGCGPGHLTKKISDRNLDVVGVDISSEKIRQARESYPQIRFIDSDICDLTMPLGSFNTVILAEVLEHVSEETGAEILNKARQLMKPGGRIIVSVPNESHIPHPNHVREFGRRDLKRMLSQFGKPKLVTDQPYKWLMMYVDCQATLGTN